VWLRVKETDWIWVTQLSGNWVQRLLTNDAKRYIRMHTKQYSFLVLWRQTQHSVHRKQVLLPHPIDHKRELMSHHIHHRQVLRMSICTATQHNGRWNGRLMISNRNRLMVETGRQWKNRECREVNVDLRIRYGQIECNAVSLLVRYRTCDSQVASSSPEHHRVVSLGKLLTPVCLCHQAV